MDFLELSQIRYSCRKFSDRPVEDEDVSRVVDAFLAAPTAVDRQPIRLWVVRSKERLADLKECTRFHFNAPAALIVAYVEDEAWVRSYDGKNHGDVDATIAATHAMLEIHELGLGSTWVACFDPAAVRRMFPETEGTVVTALFPFGYPADDAEPSPMHFQRKSEKDVVRYL